MNLDIVNGTVIGGDSVTVGLFAPNGRRQGQNKSLDQVGAREADRLGWTGVWEMRIY